MLRPDDTCHKKDNSEADEQKRSATNASTTHQNDHETETLHETNLRAVTRESVSAIVNTPISLQVTMQRQEGTVSQRKEQLGNKRKKMKESAPDGNTNQSSALQIRSEANTGRLNECTREVAIKIALN